MADSFLVLRSNSRQARRVTRRPIPRSWRTRRLGWSFEAKEMIKIAKCQMPTVARPRDNENPDAAPLILTTNYHLTMSEEVQTRPPPLDQYEKPRDSPRGSPGSRHTRKKGNGDEDDGLTEEQNADKILSAFVRYMKPRTSHILTW